MGERTPVVPPKNKNWLIFWHAPFNYNVVNNHVYLNYDTKYFFIDASDNLTFNDFGKKILAIIYIILLVKLVSE